MDIPSSLDSQADQCFLNWNEPGSGKKPNPARISVARAEGFEPPTNGFGDHYSTVELRPSTEADWTLKAV